MTEGTAMWLAVGAIGVAIVSCSALDDARTDFMTECAKAHVECKNDGLGRKQIIGPLKEAKP